MQTDDRPNIHAPDDDPYLWLEQIDEATALDWVSAQNQASLSHFAHATFAADRDSLAAIFDAKDNIPYITRRGTLLYNFWIDENNPRGLWRRCGIEDYRKDEPDWEILLDLDALAAAENEDWIWAGSTTLAPEHNRALLRLSRGGSDAIVLREFDLAEKRFAGDGFHLGEAKTAQHWIDADTVLLASALGQGMETSAGYARTLRLWKRNEDISQARILFETAKENVGVWADIEHDNGETAIWIAERIDFYRARFWVTGLNAEAVQLELPLDASAYRYRNWLLVEPRSDWQIGEREFTAGSLLAIGLQAFLNGARDFDILFEPQQRCALRNSFWAGDRLILSILDQLNPVFEVFQPHADGWQRSSLPGLPQIGIVNVWRLDMEAEESNGDLLASIQDPLKPVSLNLIEQQQAPIVLKRAPRGFDETGLEITRHEAISADGTRIPYTQIGPPGETGDAPVHLYGYGGFRVSQLPGYHAAIGKLWLERGGTRVIANIRGGGEFGPEWHEAGRREGKRDSHDDFAAVARDLVRRGITRPNRIAAEGGSNGGILMTNMLVRYPRDFGALLCTIPLIDMRRYHKLLAGSSWIAEYGDPDNPDDWAYLQTYSAYHLAEAGKDYPPILLATSRRDDRVHPGHARKMAAKLQALGYDAYFYEPDAGGHGYGKDNHDRATFIALGYAFLREKIGWLPEMA